MEYAGSLLIFDGPCNRRSGWKTTLSMAGRLTNPRLRRRNIDWLQSVIAHEVVCPSSSDYQPINLSTASLLYKK